MSGRGRGPEGMMGGMRMIEGRGGRGVASIRVRGPRIMAGLRGVEGLSGIAQRHKIQESIQVKCALIIMSLWLFMHAWFIFPSTFFVRNCYRRTVRWVLPD